MSQPRAFPAHDSRGSMRGSLGLVLIGRLLVGLHIEAESKVTSVNERGAPNYGLRHYRVNILERRDSQHGTNALWSLVMAFAVTRLRSVYAFPLVTIQSGTHLSPQITSQSLAGPALWTPRRHFVAQQLCIAAQEDLKDF